MRASFARIAWLWAILSSTSAIADDPAPPTLERIGTIRLRGPVGGLDHMAFDAEHGRLFVANTINGSLDVVDVNRGRLIEQIPGQTRIRGVDFDPKSGRLIVGNGGGGICNVFDAADRRLIRSIALGGDADNVRLHPDTGKIYVVHNDCELSVIDSTTFEVGPPIALPKSLGALKIDPTRPRLYVNAKAEGAVVAIDLVTSKIVGRFPVVPASRNASLAVDSRNRRLLVGCRVEPSIVVMDADSGKVTSRVPIPGGVDDLWLDVRRGLAIASCGDGFLGLAVRDDGDRYRPIDPIPTAKGARTSCYDDGSGRLFLGVPRHKDRPEQADPEIWVYAVRQGTW